MGSFRINDVIYDSQLYELKRQDNIVKLDPRLASLLDFFLRNPDKVLSREQLLEEVWQGAVVSDNTVNWSVSQLRKLLGDNSTAPEFILTVPKKGYRCIAEISELKNEPEPVKTDSVTDKLQTQNLRSQKTFKTKVMWPAIGLLVLFVVIYQLSIHSSDSSYRLDAGRLLTSLDGVERGGRISPDNVMLVFRHKSEATNQRYKIYLKPLIDTARLAETQSDGSVSFASVQSNRQQASYALDGLAESEQFMDVIWGRDSYQLYAIELDREECRIVELNLSVSRLEVLQKRLISTCDGRGRSRLIYHQEALIYTDASEGKPYRVVNLDLKTGAKTYLTQGSSTGLGDHFVDLHKDTQRLLILRNQDWKKTVFLEFDLISGQQKTLFESESIYYSAYWGPSGKGIWLNWGNDTIVRYDLDSGSLHTLLQSGFGLNFDAHPVAGNKAVFTVSDANASDLLRYDQQGFEKTATPFNEELPAFSPSSGHLAYVSNQSGIPQIWLKKANLPALQLTNLSEYREFHYLFWSTDEKWLVANSSNQIGVIDIDNEQFAILYQGPLSPHFPGLSSDKSTLVFAAQLKQQWHLYQVDLASEDKKASLVTEGIRHQWISDDVLFYSKHNQDGLFQFTLSDRSSQVIMPELPANVDWRVFNGVMYFRQGRDMFTTPLAHYAPEAKITLPENIVGFTLHPDGERWLFEDRSHLQTDLKIAPLINN